MNGDNGDGHLNQLLHSPLATDMVKSILILALLVCLVAAQNCGCPSNKCCSQYGYCGTTADYCGNGCRENCHQGGNTTPIPTSNNGNGGSSGGKPSFVDEFDSLDKSKWYVSDYPPSDLFASSWDTKQVRVADGKLSLVIDQQGCPNGCGGHKWRAGELATNQMYSYGYLETTFIPACEFGGISSLFTFADAAGGAEIDIEFEGNAKNCTGVSYTHYAGGKTFGWGVKPLGFNAKEKAHTYGFLWTPEKVDWYVDHKLHFSTASSGKKVDVPSAKMNLMVNNWVVSNQNDYYGKFPQGKTVVATYERIAYYPLDSLPDFITGHSSTSGPSPTTASPKPTQSTGAKPTKTRRTPTTTAATTGATTSATTAITPTSGDDGGRPSFTDDFNSLDTSKWYVSNYSPSSLFASSWDTKQVRVADGKLSLVIDQQGCPNGCGGHKWRAGELATNQMYTYGYVETTFIPACEFGGISSLFTYADAAGGAEIDIEFEGNAKNCTGVSYTHYAGGKTFGWGVKSLGFNAKEKAHTYGFLWTPEKVDWYVDHKLHFSTASSGKKVDVPSAKMNLMVNNWVVSNQDAYYGKFPEGKTVVATYEKLVYYPLNALPNFVKA
ncbi:glycoside hydrolase family protein [Planoprotostelium fungivorum]|uniref:Glycoside hydrolase family protein n=1 Tax=Planoprotostelium fungivorum TaxID=1890364 RepID=A0A2P6MQG7_9EUKA|nr:glycoside hydrolase family protein [Planoprotostelium fungivorum]